MARSSAKTEYRVMTGRVLTFMAKILMHELRITIGGSVLRVMTIQLSTLRITIGGPMLLLCDDNATINIVHNPVQHDQMKYMEVDEHLIKEKLNDKTITEEQLPNMITKGFICRMCMRDIHASS